jgi:type II secretory pathway component PulF
MLAWVIATAGARGPLAPALRHAAATYRARAARKAESLQAILPSVVLLVVGTAAGAIYALSVFKPVITLWYQLAIPVSD